MGIDRGGVVRLVQELVITDGRVWTGNTLNQLPHGWGQVCYNGTSVWSHFVYGAPHFTVDMVTPTGISLCSFMGVGGLIFSGYIDMGVPISGSVTLNDYKFIGLFDRSTCSPSVGTRFYQTENGLASWMGRLDKHGQRQGAGVMKYADGTSVKGVWKNDEISDGHYTILFGDGRSVDVVLSDGYSRVWPTKHLWSKIQHSLVKELFHDSLYKQRESFLTFLQRGLKRDV